MLFTSTMANSPVLVPARRVHSPPATFRQAAPTTAVPLVSLPPQMQNVAHCSQCGSSIGAGHNFCGKCGAERPRTIPSRVLRPVNGDMPQQAAQPGPWLMEPVTARLSNAPQSQPSSFTAMPGPPRHIVTSQLRTSSPRQIRGTSKPDDEYRDRRPTDPFFYPTTVSPLTGLGLNLIEESTPPKPQDMAPRVLEDLRSPMKPNSFADLEDMSVLQRQNDELAKHMQDLERAKSLAAMTSAQALQKIRQRQEQLRKEQQLCMVRAKEIQADYSPGPEVEGPMVVPQPQPQLLPEGAHERRTPAKVEPEDIGQTQLPQPTGGISSTASTLRRSDAEPAKRSSAIRPCLSSRSSDARESAGEGSPPTSKRSMEVTQMAPVVPEYTGDITAMAATMLSKHQTPGYREAPMDPAPYVDALGNPLPPIRKLDDLPNIKDTPPESSAAEVEGPISGTSALIQVDSGPSISQPEEDSPRNKARSARLDKPAEKPVVMVAHERGPPNSSRSDRQGSHSSAGSRGSRSGVDAAGEGSKSSKPRPKASGSALVPPEVAEELQAELDECLDTIKWCASSITRDSLQDVKNTNRPAPVVKDVLEAVSILLAQPETRWDRLKQMISKPQFFDKLQRLDFQRSISKEQFKKLRDKLANPHFDEELIKTVSVPMVPLAMWCRAIGVYLSKTKYRGGPEIRPVAGAGATPQLHYEERREKVEMSIQPDLSVLSDEELRHVRDLTISREGVGTITFEGETDCSNLDFQNIVRLEVGEVLVYPHPKTKPEVGVGLNKAATVTMYQCWPPNGSMLAQDLEQQEEYKRRIKVMTEEKKARFIDYDCMMGVWKFGVDHF